MKRDRTPTFWISDPVGLLPRGQLDLPLVQEPKRDASLARDPATFVNCRKCDARRSDVRDRGNGPECRRCYENSTLVECEGCRADVFIAETIENDRGCILCEGCADDEERFESTFGPEDECRD